MIRLAVAIATFGVVLAIGTTFSPIPGVRLSPAPGATLLVGLLVLVAWSILVDATKKD